MDYVSTVDQNNASDTQKLYKSLSYMLGVLREKGADEQRIEQLRKRLEDDGFLTSVPVTKATSETEPSSGPVVDEIIQTLRGLDRALREFEQQHRYDSRDYNLITIKDEYDLQDFLRGFLRMRFSHADVETPVGKVAGVGGRVDFSLGREKIFIELKVLRSEADWKGMFADLASKIERYSTDANCDDLIFFVYDPTGCLRTAPKAEADMSMRRSKGEKYFNTYLVIAPQR